MRRKLLQLLLVRAQSDLGVVAAASVVKKLLVIRQQVQRLSLAAEKEPTEYKKVGPTFYRKTWDVSSTTRRTTSLFPLISKFVLEVDAEATLSERHRKPGTGGRSERRQGVKDGDALGLTTSLHA